MPSMEAKTAILWSSVDVFFRRGLQFGFSIILARLLVPEDFGVIAILSLFIQVATVFVDAGLSAALIQKQDTTHTDESTAFWFNLGMAIVMMLALCGMAPTIARFYDMPDLAPLTMALALNILASAAGSIHATLLVKRLDFKPQMKAGVIATLISGIAGTALALAGYGAWALVGQTLASTIASSLLFWIFNPWRPAFTCRWSSLKTLLDFGGYVLAAHLLDTVYNRLYALFIGKLYGVRDVGFYSRADSTQQLPTGLISEIVSRVVFPIFSASSHTPAMLQGSARLSVQATMLVTCPVMLGLWAVAEHFVVVIFGPIWQPAVPILEILCIAGLFYPLHVINLNIIKAMGYAKLFLRIEIFKKSMCGILLVIGSYYGIAGVAYSIVAANIISFFINTHYSGKFLGYGAAQQLLDTMPSLVASLLMAAAVTWSSHFIGLSLAMEFPLLVTIGILSYGIASLLPGLNQWKDLYHAIRR